MDSKLLPFSPLPPLSPRSRAGILCMAAIVAIINPTANGYDASMMGSILALDQYKNQFHLNEHTTGLNNGSMFIGLFLSVPLIKYFSDTFGRKKAISAGVAIMIVAVIIMVTSNVIGQFVVGRILYGLGAGIAGGAAPTLVAELCPPDLRARVIGVYHSCYYVGSLIAAGVTYGSMDIQGSWAWRLPTLIVIVPTFLCFVNLYFCPESPRWLVMNGKVNEAREILLILEQDEESADSFIQEVSLSINAELSYYNSATAWKEMISSKANLRRILIMCSLGLMCELSGSSIGTFYFTVLLEQAGVKSNSTQLKVGMIRSAYCLLWSLIGCMTLDVLGRKLQGFLSMLGNIVSLFLLGALIKLYGNSTNISGQYGAIAMMFISGGAYSWCFTPLLSLYPTEIFPNRTRALGASIFFFFDDAAGIFCTFMSSIGMNNMGYKFYMLTGAYDILFLPMIAFLWVETSRVSLEKIADLFGDGEIAAGVLEIEASSSDRENIVVSPNKM